MTRNVLVTHCRLWIVITAAILLSLLSLSTTAQSAEDVSKLHDILYLVNPNTRPIRNATIKTNILVSFYLINIHGLEMATQKLKCSGFLVVTWTDEYMVWRPSDHGGVKMIYPDPNKVWRPKLVFQNSLKDFKPVGLDFVLLSAYYNGSVTWFPAETLETFCKVDVTYFPYDIQRCYFPIATWSEGSTQTVLSASDSTMNMDFYTGDGEWVLVSSSVNRTLKGLGNELFYFLTYEVTLRRHPVLLVLTVLIPVLVLAMVNVFVFVIPTESGEMSGR